MNTDLMLEAISISLKIISILHMCTIPSFSKLNKNCLPSTFPFFIALLYSSWLYELANKIMLYSLLESDD